MRRERLYLEDILAAADAIAEFVEGQQLEAFRADRMRRSAVTNQLTIIGEAVAHLSEEFKQLHPDIPWSDIKALRNIVVHNYFGVDWEEVWRAAIEDAPVLRARIARILGSA
jgi:uncharacterized protein with HEPN domain